MVTCVRRRVRLRAQGGRATAIERREARLVVGELALAALYPEKCEQADFISGW